MLIMRSGKQHMMEGTERPNQEKIKKGKSQILANIGSRHHQTSRDGRKNLKRVSQENKETIQNQTISEKSYQRDKCLCCLSCKILGTILKVDKGGT